MKKYHAFTLIELSIVLVIIGLIVGGVLMGREMIEVAKIRSQVSQIEKIASAQSTFRNKYNAIPGDFCAKAASVGLKCGSQSTGRDNGIVNGTDGGVHELFSEPTTFFGQLADSNLMEKNMICVNTANASLATAGHFATAINPNASMAAYTFQGSVWIALALTPQNPISSCTLNNYAGYTSNGIMTPAQAYAIDVKLDDGVPSTGTVFAQKRAWDIAAGRYDNTVNQCSKDSAGTKYNIADETNYCILLVKLP